MLVLAGVVVGTGLMTGSFGLRMLGSGHVGGKDYFYFLAAVAGYFVLTSRRIPPHRAGLYVAMFFLSRAHFRPGSDRQPRRFKLSFLSAVLGHGQFAG